MKLFILCLIFILFLSPCNAVIITEPIKFEIYTNTIYITIYNQSAEFFNVSTLGHYLDININNTHLNLTTTTNKTITGIIYFNDILVFLVNGSGTLTTFVIMNESNTSYSFYVDNVLSSIIRTDTIGNVGFNFEISDNITYEVKIIKTPILESMKRIACNNISNFESSTILIASLGVMIIGLSFVLFSIKTQRYRMILLGITTSILGFASLLFGNYMFASLQNILC